MPVITNHKRVIASEGTWCSWLSRSLSGSSGPMREGSGSISDVSIFISRLKSEVGYIVSHQQSREHPSCSGGGLKIQGGRSCFVPRPAAPSTSIERVPAIATSNKTLPLCALRPPPSYFVSAVTATSVEARCLVFSFKISPPSRSIRTF